MQLSEMVARVSQRLAEGSTGPVYYPRSEIVAALNEAHRFFVLLTLGLETTATWNVSAATTWFHMLTIFADWIVPLRITDSTGAKVRPARIAELTALDQGWASSAGAPVRYCAEGADLVGLYKQPASGGTALTVTYARAPLPLVSDADAPETPDEYHPQLVGYAVYRCRQGEGAQEFEKVLGNLEAFLKAAKQFGDYVRARNRGSQYDKVPFEMERFDRSKLLQMRADLMPARKAG